MKKTFLILAFVLIGSIASASSVCGKVKSIATTGGRLGISVDSPQYKTVSVDVWISKNDSPFGAATLTEEAATQRVLSMAQTALTSGTQFCVFVEKAVVPGSNSQAAYLRVKEADSVSVGN